MSNFISSTHSSMAFRSQMSSRRDWIFWSSWEGFLLAAAALVVSSFSCKETPSTGYWLYQADIDLAAGRSWTCLRVCAVVHEHHVVFPRYFLKCVALFPLIRGFLMEPGEKQFKCFNDELTENGSEKGDFNPIVQAYFFLKSSLAFCRFPPHDFRLF